ncbi:hypothetical protein [Microbulbifer sp. TYP-18]|uniref:hypothetical protein n=1 Tax=Microbulbifer sp. TYP-18 TaxID=3230024 RepID=UPI0034C6D75E
MVTLNAVSVKMVRACAVVVILVSSLPAAAGELAIPMLEVQRDLTLKAEQAFTRKFNECGDGVRHQKNQKEPTGPRFPVRIAAQEQIFEGLAASLVGIELAIRPRGNSVGL